MGRGVTLAVVATAALFAIVALTAPQQNVLQQVMLYSLNFKAVKSALNVVGHRLHLPHADCVHTRWVQVTKPLPSWSASSAMAQMGLKSQVRFSMPLMSVTDDRLFGRQIQNESSADDSLNRCQCIGSCTHTWRKDP